MRGAGPSLRGPWARWKADVVEATPSARGGVGIREETRPVDSSRVRGETEVAAAVVTATQYHTHLDTS